MRAPLLKNYRKEREAERKERDVERRFQMELLQKKYDLGMRNSQDIVNEENFDVSKWGKLVPGFDENDPDEFFLHFEKIALNRNWPKEHWPALIQGVLKGKGRSAYLSLTLAQSTDYDTIKEAVSKAYKLTAEHYRCNFRNTKKDSSQSYVEYSHSLSKMFDKWIISSQANSFEKLKELILLEELGKSR